MTVSEPATVGASVRVPGVATLRSAAYTLAPGIPGVFRISTKGSRGKRVRRAVARRSRVAALTVTARDAFGNTARAVRRVRLR